MIELTIGQASLYFGTEIICFEKNHIACLSCIKEFFFSDSILIKVLTQFFC